jgi:hypothetical protein
MTPCTLAIASVLSALPGTEPAFANHVPALAQSIASVASSPERAAVYVTIGRFESNFLERVQAGNCKPWECDRGRARSWFQLHAQRMVPRAEWLTLTGLEPEAIARATNAAARIVDRGFRACGTMGGVLSYYARGACRGWTGVEGRRMFSERIRPKLLACTGSS